MTDMDATLEQLRGFLIFLRSREQTRAEKLKISPASYEFRSDKRQEGIAVWACAVGCEILSFVISWDGVIYDSKGQALAELQEPETWRLT